MICFEEFHVSGTGWGVGDKVPSLVKSRVMFVEGCVSDRITFVAPSASSDSGPTFCDHSTQTHALVDCRMVRTTSPSAG